MEKDQHDDNDCACCDLYAQHPPANLTREELERRWREFLAEGRQPTD